MANGTKYNKRNRKKKYMRKNRRNYKKSNKSYKVSIQKLASKKIDTLFEKRMVEIANSNRVSLISRKFLFGTYDKTNNFISSFGDVVKNNWLGRVVELSNIPKIDLNFVVNAPQIDDPDTQFNENSGDPDGAQQGMVTQSNHNRRQGDSIKVHGISVQMICQMLPYIHTETNHEVVGAWPGSENYPKTTIKWSVVSVRNVDNATPNIEPEAYNVIKMHTYGYSNRLDTDEADDTALYKYKTLMNGTINMFSSYDRHKSYNVTRYLKFNEPLIIQYAPTSQNGQVCLKDKLFFCLRTNIPNAADIGGLADDTLTYAYPRIFTITKLHYYDL